MISPHYGALAGNSARAPLAGHPRKQYVAKWNLLCGEYAEELRNPTPSEIEINWAETYGNAVVLIPLAKPSEEAAEEKPDAREKPHCDCDHRSNELHVGRRNAKQSQALPKR